MQKTKMLREEAESIRRVSSNIPFINPSISLNHH